MNVTFSLFGYFFSLQIFRSIFVPIDRMDCQRTIPSLDLKDESAELESRHPLLEEFQGPVT